MRGRRQEERFANWAESGAYASAARRRRGSSHRRAGDGHERPTLPSGSRSADQTAADVLRTEPCRRPVFRGLRRRWVRTPPPNRECTEWGARRRVPPVGEARTRMNASGSRLGEHDRSPRTTVVNEPSRSVRRSGPSEPETARCFGGWSDLNTGTTLWDGLPGVNREGVAWARLLEQLPDQTADLALPP